MNNLDLSLVFIAGNLAEESMVKKYNSVYQHWESVWSDTFREIKGNRRFFSDNFTRQDEVMALFHKDECIAVCCHRFANMALASFKQDSYFQAWPETAMAKLRQKGDSLVIDNQISVDPRFRKTFEGIRIIDLLAFLSMRHLMQLPISGVAAASRNMRSMDELFERFNPEKVADKVMFHGEETSLYFYYHDRTVFDRFPDNIRDLADSLLESSTRSTYVNPIFSSKRGGLRVQKSA